MKRKVLLITCEKLPGGKRPVTGGGLRVHGLAQGLGAHGHQVMISIPAEAVEKDDPDSIKELSHVPENLPELIFRVMPDLVLVEQWGLSTYLPEMDIPLILDLHGPLTLENAFKKGSNFRTDALTKIDALSKADLLIVPGKAQKDYFLTWFLMAGADPKAPPILTVPVSLDPPAIKRRKGDPPRIVFGGSTWPWINPFPGLRVAGQVAESIENAEIALYVGRPPLALDHPLYEINREAYADYEKRLEGLSAVKSHALIPHDELLGVYAGARAALDVYQSNPERDLAYSTRTVEYLRCGLPVITSIHMELAVPVRRFDAGWVVEPNDEKAIAAAVREALGDGEITKVKSRNALRLSNEMFQHKRATAALAKWVSRPIQRKKGRHLLADFRDYYRSESVALINSAQDKVTKISEEMRAVSQEFQKQLALKDERYELLAADMRKKRGEHDGELRKLAELQAREDGESRKDIRRLQEKLDKQQEQTDGNIRRVEKDYRQQLGQLETEIKSLNREKENSRDKHGEEIKTLIARHEEETARLRARADEEAARGEKRFIQEVEKRDELKKELDAELKSVNREKQDAAKNAEKETKALSARHEKETARLRARADAGAAEWEQRFVREVEKREDQKKEMDAELKRVNREKQDAAKAATEEIKTITLRSEDKLIEAGKEAEREIRKREKRIEKQEDRLEAHETEHRATLREMEEEKKRIIHLREDEAKAMKAKEEEILVQLRQTQEAALEKDGEIRKAVEKVGELEERLESADHELKARQEALSTLNAQLDRLNAEIKSRFVEIDRVISEKEAFVTAAKERFDSLEGKTTEQAGRITTLEKDISHTRGELQRASVELAATSRNHQLVLADLEKTTRHASDLEGEVGVLRRKYALAECILVDIRGDQGDKKRRRKRHRRRKYTKRLPGLAFLWVLNILSNLYMAWWQRRKGVQIFPGMKKIENDPSPR